MQVTFAGNQVKSPAFSLLNASEDVNPPAAQVPHPSTGRIEPSLSNLMNPEFLKLSRH